MFTSTCPWLRISPISSYQSFRHFYCYRFSVFYIDFQQKYRLDVMLKLCILICNPEIKEVHIYPELVHYHNVWNSQRIPGVMINVLPTSVVDHGFKPQSGQTKDYNKNVDVKFSVHHLFWNNLHLVLSKSCRCQI